MRGLVEYLNIPPTIATVVSARMATFHELDTVYGMIDLWNMLEIIAVDRHNQRMANMARD